MLNGNIGDPGLIGLEAVTQSIEVRRQPALRSASIACASSASQARS